MAAQFIPVREEVRHIAPYNAGLSTEDVRTRFGVERIAKLGSNENPFGPSKRTLDCLHDLASLVRLYPDPEGKRLCAALSEALSVDADRLILGNGSEDLISVITRAVLRPGDIVVTLYPSFPLHEDYPALMGSMIRRVQVRDDLSIDVDALLAEIARQPRMVMFSNPMNPVGSWLSSGDLRRVIAALGRETLLVLDEAYAEYLNDADATSSLDMLRGCDAPWIVLRTFSKAYGLAGLRVGFGVASTSELNAFLHRVRTPFNVNAIAQAMAEAALSDDEHLARTVNLAASERERVQRALRQLGYQVTPSQANFLFFDVRSNAEVVSERFLRRGVIVKPWKQSGFETFLRVSIGSPQDNDMFLECIGPNG